MLVLRDENVGGFVVELAAGKEEGEVEMGAGVWGLIKGVDVIWIRVPVARRVGWAQGVEVDFASELRREAAEE